MEITDTELENSHGRQIFFKFLTDAFGDRAQSILKKFDILTRAYAEINSVINISALRTLDDIYIKHFLDSIVPYKHFGGECCDVGCGGGFPCLPLAIITENTYIGVDGVGKKLKLIDLASKTLGLTNISAMHVRAEDLAKTNIFDTVCARAVADIDTALGYCAPLAKGGGRIVLYRTQADEKAKIKTEKKFKIEFVDMIDYSLPYTDINRRLFVYEKNKSA